MSAATDASRDYEILVRIGQIARLFDPFDPSPIEERDLDAKAIRFIYEWAEDAPRAARISVVVQLPKDERDHIQAATIETAIRNNFAYRVERATRELRDLLKEGWRSLLIGVPILAFSLVASQLIGAAVAPTSPLRVVSESLLILGWVANWRPLEIFLYGWWPIVRRRRLYRRLAAGRIAMRWA